MAVYRTHVAAAECNFATQDVRITSGCIYVTLSDLSPFPPFLLTFGVFSFAMYSLLLRPLVVKSTLLRLMIGLSCYMRNCTQLLHESCTQPSYQSFLRMWKMRKKTCGRRPHAAPYLTIGTWPRLKHTAVSLTRGRVPVVWRISFKLDTRPRAAA